MSIETPRQRRQRRPRDRKAQLAAVAAKLFCARGYHEVGITEIAAAAGITGPALYRHFADKQAMLTHVVLSGIDELFAATHSALDDSEEPAPDQVDALLEALARMSVERRDIAALWRREGRNLSAAGRDTIRRRHAELIGWWADTLRAMRSTLTPADADLLCTAALSVFGSTSVHSTRIGKRRYVELLTGGTHRVLHCTLPAPGADPAPSALSADQAVLRASRREQLITAAGQLFQERGFHDVSMEDIGSAAGISGPSVYRHFPSKAALFMAAALRINDRLELGRQRVASESADEAQALRGLVASYIETMLSSADLFVIGNQVSALTAAERGELRRVQRDYVSEWTRLLAAVRPELNPPECRVTVHMALTIANDLIHTARIRARPHVHAELVTVMTATLGIPSAITHVT